MNGRLPAHADSNLDLLGRADHDFDDPMHCPCLPEVVLIGREPETGEPVMRFLHDAVMARVLRAEGGHP